MPSTPAYLSVIIPTYNERENISELVARLVSTLDTTKKSYELIFIDDRSSDGTLDALKAIAHPSIMVYAKVGPQGKAYSLLEGFEYASGSIISFIDADLQYPPEGFIAALELMKDNDIAVAERSERHTSLLRSVLSRSFRFIFGKVLLGISVDVQSGMKMFKREQLSRLTLQPTAWGLDYQLLFEAGRAGARIAGFPIVFSERKNGESTINPFKVGLELSVGALKLRAGAIRQHISSFFQKEA